MLNESYFFSIYGKLSYQPKRMKDFLVLFSISKRALPQLIQTSAVRRHGIKVGPGETGALFYENYISRVSYPFSKTVDLTRICYIRYIYCIALVVLFRTPCIRTLACGTACGINFVFLKVSEPESFSPRNSDYKVVNWIILCNERLNYSINTKRISYCL